MVIGDELRISQVLINLLTNAAKFTPRGGKISLIITEDKPQIISGKSKIKIRAEVKDTGIGISAEAQKRLFNSFVQAETGTTRKYGGTGLGLAICKKIINMMHGEIWIDSEVGNGSVFAFEIMLGLGRQLKDAKHGKENSSTAPARNWSKKTILIAEDMEINREIINTLLKNTKVNIDNAVDGAEAFEMYSKNPGKFDLILMDIHMPNMNGLDATRKIRTLEADLPELKKRIPIIAMTASAFSEDIHNSLDSGMDRHLAKPVELTEVFRVLDDYLDE
jgi:CheY-like chemotaxis protein